MSLEPDTLETLIGADGDGRRAFLTILLQTLRRLETGVGDVSRKLDAMEDGHARDVASALARTQAVESRVLALEEHIENKGEGNWRTLQAVASWSAIVIALLAMLLKH